MMFGIVVFLQNTPRAAARGQGMDETKSGYTLRIAGNGEGCMGVYVTVLPTFVYAWRFSC